MKPNRRIFSRKDGTTTIEDVKDIASDIADFLRRVPVRIRELLPEAEDIVIAIEGFADDIREGQPLDLAIDRALALIPGTQQEAFYEIARQALMTFAVKLRIILDKTTDVVDGLEGVSAAGGVKREAAVKLIRSFNGNKPTENEAALALEMQLWALRAAG